MLQNNIKQLRTQLSITQRELAFKVFPLSITLA